MLKTVGNQSTRTGDQTIVDGNLVIGTAGKGIDFSADAHAAGMTSELFDDYEEGTWSPVVTAGTGAISSYTATGTYTKVGRLVTVFYNVLISANGTGAGFVKVAGLPYNIAENRAYGVGQETDAVGLNTVSQAIVGTDYSNITTFAGTYPGGSGYRLQGNFTYTA